MLTKDYEHFVWKHPDAVLYMKQAAARFELYLILRELSRVDQRSERATWIRAQVREARQTVACQEPWFLDLLRNDHGGIAKTLLQLMESIP